MKVGLMVPLFKKGDRNDCVNYTGICLLTMLSRILARVIAKRSGWWAEHMGMLDENQSGVRKGRSTGDAAQIMVRMQEDVCDWKRRMEERGLEDRGQEECPVARLLDLQKAGKHNVNKA